MKEWEALIQRRKMLADKISKMDYEIEKIDLRLDFLGKLALSEQSDEYSIQEQFVQQVS
jgi:hypothetical protein